MKYDHQNWSQIKYNKKKQHTFRVSLDDMKYG